MRPTISPIPPYEEALNGAADDDRQWAEQHFTTPIRRAEWLTWRRVARGLTCEVAPDVKFQIGYNECGAPEARSTANPCDKYYIGVSHCRGYVAVVVSDSPCGVDIEHCDRNFERASSKFLSHEERALEECYPELLAGAVWCAKEAVYKRYSAEGHKYPDFLTDLRVTHSDLAHGEVWVAAGDNAPQKVCIEWKKVGDDRLIVATVGLQTTQAANLKE